MSVGLLGFASAVPETIRHNDHWANTLSASRHLLEIERSADGARLPLPPEIVEAIAEVHDPSVFKGAKRRRVIADHEQVSDLEARAVRAALADARVDPERVDVLMVGSIVPDYVNPSNAPALQDKCGLSRAAAWSVEAACASFQVQLVSAAGLVEAGLCDVAVIVHSQVVSRVLRDDDPTSPTFGDGAAAAVVGRVPAGFGLLGHYAKTEGRFRGGVMLAPVGAAGVCTRWWEGTRAHWGVGSVDREAVRETGARAPDFCREACGGALARAGMRVDDIAHYVGNQSVSWFVGACRRALGIPAERAVSTFEDVANIGAAAILHNLGELRAAGRLRHGDAVLMYSPAVGFSRTAVVYRHHEVGG